MISVIKKHCRAVVDYGRAIDNKQKNAQRPDDLEPFVVQVQSIEQLPKHFRLTVVDPSSESKETFKMTCLSQVGQHVDIKEKSSKDDAIKIRVGSCIRVTRYVVHHDSGVIRFLIVAARLLKSSSN